MFDRKIFAVLFAASSFCVICSLCAEFIFGLVPCVLCWTQRVLHGFLCVASFCGIQFSFSKICKRLCFILLLASVFAASYHALIQWGVVEDRCKAINRPIKDADAYRSLLLAKRVSCAESGWGFGIIPIPAVNAFVSLALLSLFYHPIQVILRRQKNL